MPNTLAYLMLLIWPVLAAVLFQKLPKEKALIWSILAAYMVLPPLASFSLPGLPDLDKYTVSNLCSLVLVLFYLNIKVPVLPAGLIGKVLLVLFIASPFFTTLTNPDPIKILAGDIPALRLYDSVATVSYQIIALIPFFLARRLLASEEGMRVLVTILVSAGLIYSLPMLLEARLSPQLNVWIYGFFAHDFSQAIREGGFRPMVFMPHGLWVAFFALMCAMSALQLMKLAPSNERAKQTMIFLYLLYILMICKSTGPTVYALGLIPLIMFASRRMQVLLAAALAVVVITYPLLRGAHLVPLEQILNYALSYSIERHESLQFRIFNEEALLARAMEKPWFGWGGYARSLVHDPVSGMLLTIPDGKWIIVLGTYGWSGYIAEFGLLILPLILFAREALHRKSEALSPFACLVALIYVANLADLLPNATLIPFTWLMSGALLGYVEMLAANRAAGVSAPTAASAPAAQALPQRPRTIL